MLNAKKTEGLETLLIVMTAVPGLRASSLPFLSTFITLSLLDSKVTRLSVACTGLIVISNCKIS